MSQRTDLPSPDERPELSNEYLLSLVVATAVILLLIFVIGPMAGNPLRINRALPYLYAWVIAGGITIARGLTEFSGNTPEVLELPVLTSVLASLLLVGVIAPTLALKLMRSRASVPVRHGGRAFYLVGLIIAVTFAATVAPTGYIGWRVAESMRTAQAVQRNKDLMINDLNVIAMRVHEYRILPKRFGGGEGSSASFVLAPDLAKTDEGTYTVTTSGDEVVVNARSQKHEGCTITVKVGSDGHLDYWSYGGQFQ